MKAILTNITYTGNMLFQKEYSEGTITKHRRKNYGELPQYFAEDTHEAIIPMDEWQAVQAEFKRRRDLGPFGNKLLKLSAFSTKITCSCCGKHHRHNRKRNTAGEVTVPFKRFLGYDMGPDHNLVVNLEQAKLVKRIYGMFLQGQSPFQIARTLTEEGIPSPGGKDHWNPSNIKSILTNEKYKGTH